MHCHVMSTLLSTQVEVMHVLLSVTKAVSRRSFVRGELKHVQVRWRSCIICNPRLLGLLPNMDVQNNVLDYGHDCFTKESCLHDYVYVFK